MNWLDGIPKLSLYAELSKSNVMLAYQDDCIVIDPTGFGGKCYAIPPYAGYIYG